MMEDAELDVVEMNAAQFGTRRDLLRRAGVAGASGLGLLAAGGGLPALARAATPYHPAESPLYPTAENAVIFGAPAILMEAYLAASRKLNYPINRFYVNTGLSTPATAGIGPNVDTLYGLAWFDLSSGPQVIEVPEVRDRYYSIQFVDFWSNSFAYIGTRQTGTDAGVYALTPPGWKGKVPPGIHQIKATTRRVFSLVRTLVKDPQDLKAAQKVHKSYTTGPLRAYPRRRLHPKTAPSSFQVNNVTTPVNLAPLGAELFQQVNNVIAKYPPLPPDAAYARTLQPVGVDVKTYVPPGPDLEPILASAVQPALTAAAAYRKAITTVVNGWGVIYGTKGITHEPLKRLALCVYGPGVHVAKEALYFGAGTLNGAPLNGTKAYELVFPKGTQPPLEPGGFWSLIMYDAKTLLVENPIRRYEIASHNTDDLVYRPDGSLSITMSAAQPADPTTNWLPAPAGPFSITLRTYIAKRPVLDGSWTPPPLQAI